MVDPFLTGLRSIFMLIWSIFTSWEIPFIEMTPASFFMAMLVLGLVSFAFKTLLGMTGGVSLAAGGAYKDLKRRNDAARREAENEARYQRRLAERRAYYESRRHHRKH